MIGHMSNLLLLRRRYCFVGPLLTLVVALSPVASQETVLPSAFNFDLEEPVVYRVKQLVELDQIPAGSKQVRMWVSIPGDETHQRLRSLKVTSAPTEWKFVQDAERRGNFVYCQVDNPTSDKVRVEVEFTVERDPVLTEVLPQRVGDLDESMTSLMAEHLVKDAPHMQVNDKVQAIADSVCGDVTNLGVQVTLLMQHLLKSVDHYSNSKDPDMPRCGIGDSETCLTQGGGCCTDVNSLFIALARARGIPCRLKMGYRLQEANIEKTVDPGYRCWVEYFLPSYGWLSTDLVEADAPAGFGILRWSSGLTARRVWLNSGREFYFDGTKDGKPVNHMSIAHAEIDGVPARVIPEGDLKAQITRQVFFSEIDQD